MGAGASSASVQEATIRRHCVGEFTNLCPKGQDYLVLSQIRQLQSLEDMPIDMTHLATLYVLDADRNGKVTIDELIGFATLCATKAKEFRPHEFQQQMQGYCTLSLFDEVSARGPDEFVNWFALLFSECVPFRTFSDYPGVQFITRDAAHLVHEFLQVDDNYGYDMQRFFDLCQRTGEELGIMSLHDERLDELVPVSVVDKLALSFIQGFEKLMADLNLRPRPVGAPAPPADGS